LNYECFTFSIFNSKIKLSETEQNICRSSINMNHATVVADITFFLTNAFLSTTKTEARQLTIVVDRVWVEIITTSFPCSFRRLLAYSFHAKTAERVLLITNKDCMYVIVLLATTETIVSCCKKLRVSKTATEATTINALIQLHTYVHDNHYCWPVVLCFYALLL